MNSNEFIEDYKFITTVIIKYGWVITPFMINYQFQEVLQLCINIDSTPPLNHLDRERYQNKINGLLMDISFHPGHRAFFVYRSRELNHINKFSHHLERAIFQYYKNDYFSTVLCLLPAIEGALLSYFGWDYKSKNNKPKISLLIKEIEKCRASLNEKDMYHLYSEAIVIFLKEWIYKETKEADTSLSFLNRHYAAHAMGNGNYYSIADAHRLIMFFDLFIEFLSLEQWKHYSFIPDFNVQVNERHEYYVRLIERKISLDEMLQTESKFMSDNSGYIPENNMPDWKNQGVLADWNFIQKLKGLEKKIL